LPAPDAVLFDRSPVRTVALQLASSFPLRTAVHG
jgi:hypothetical protein